MKKGAPWIGRADRVNPELDMLEVWKIYMESLGKDPRRIIARYPERIERHRRLVEQATAEAISGRVLPGKRALLPATP